MPLYSETSGPLRMIRQQEIDPALHAANRRMMQARSQARRLIDKTAKDDTDARAGVTPEMRAMKEAKAREDMIAAIMETTGGTREEAVIEVDTYLARAVLEPDVAAAVKKREQELGKRGLERMGGRAAFGRRKAAQRQATEAVDRGDSATVSQILGVRAEYDTAPGVFQKAWTVGGIRMSPSKVKQRVLDKAGQAMTRAMREPFAPTMEERGRAGVRREAEEALLPGVPVAPTKPKPVRIGKGATPGEYINLDTGEVVRFDLEQQRRAVEHARQVTKAQRGPTPTRGQKVLPDGTWVQYKIKPNGEIDPDSIQPLREQPPKVDMETRTVRNAETSVREKVWGYWEQPTKKGEKPKWVDVDRIEVAEPDREITVQNEQTGEYGVWNTGTGDVVPMKEGWKPPEGTSVGFPREMTARFGKGDTDPISGEVITEEEGRERSVFGVMTKDAQGKPVLVLDGRIVGAMWEALQTGRPVGLPLGPPPPAGSAGAMGAEAGGATAEQPAAPPEAAPEKEPLPDIGISNPETEKALDVLEQGGITAPTEEQLYWTIVGMRAAKGTR